MWLIDDIARTIASFASTASEVIGSFFSSSEQRRKKEKTKVTQQSAATTLSKTKTEIKQAQSKTTTASDGVTTSSTTQSYSGVEKKNKGFDPLRAVTQAASNIVSTVAKTVNDAVATVEKVTGIDIPGVGTVIRHPEKAPVQQYLKHATDMRTYGVGLTHAATKIVEKVTPSTQTSSNALVDAGRTFMRTVGATVLGGLAFVPDTIAEEAKAVGEVLRGNISGAVYHATRPITMVGAGIAGTVETTARFLVEGGKFMQETQEATLAAVKDIVTHGKITQDTINEAKDMMQSTQKFLNATAELGGMLVGLATLGKVYSRITTATQNTYLRVKAKTSQTYIRDPGIKWVESTTIPKTREQLLATQGKKVTVVHMTNHPEMIKAVQKGEVILGAKPEYAMGWRKEIDALHFYVSAPDNGRPTGYLAYVGIGSGESGSVKFVWKRPTPHALVFEDIVAKLPKEIITAGEKGDVKTVATYIGQQSGKLMIPTENLLGLSIEGQYVYPAKFRGNFAEYPGTRVTLKPRGWTLYAEGEGVVTPGTTLSIIKDFFKDLVTGRKLYQINLVEAKAHPIPGTGGQGMNPTKTPKIDMKEYTSSYGRVQYVSIPEQMVTLSQGRGSAPSLGSSTVQNTSSPNQQRKQKNQSPNSSTESESEETLLSPPPSPSETGPAPKPRPSPPSSPRKLSWVEKPPSSPPPSSPSSPPPFPSSSPSKPKQSNNKNMHSPHHHLSYRDKSIWSGLVNILKARGIPSLFRAKNVINPIKNLRKRMGLTNRRLPKGKIKKSLLADLLSVTESHAWFGKATHPKPTKQIWKLGEKTLFMRVPTKELLSFKKQLKKGKGTNKKRRRKS